jgi:hypothetical protein
MTTPYIGFGNDQLEGKPIVHAGDVFLCRQCGQLHELKGGTDENGEVTELLLFYNCGEKAYLAAVANKLVIDVNPPVSGSI